MSTVERGNNVVAHVVKKINHYHDMYLSSNTQSRNKGGTSGALAPGAVHVGAQNE
jgi:hypothetical protein